MEIKRQSQALGLMQRASSGIIQTSSFLSIIKSSRTVKCKVCGKKKCSEHERVGSNESVDIITEEGPEEPPKIKWQQGKLIGQGAFGKVFHGLNTETGEILAVKQVVIGSSDVTRGLIIRMRAKRSD